MRLKHFLFLISLGCALAEIGMAVYAMHWGSIIEQIANAEKSQPASELLIVRALNIAVPAGIACLGLLIYTRKIDSIGGFAMLMAAVLHMIGLDLNVRAVKKVYGSGTPLAEVTWWAPTDKQAESSNPPDDGPS